jgi:predicted nucleic-acid-binding protein
MRSSSAKRSCLQKTVILETESVLRHLYRFGLARIADAFVALIALPDLVCEDTDAIADAIQWMRAGMDFADALHLASARPAGRFATFDDRLAKHAAKIAEITVIRP